MYIIFNFILVKDLDMFYIKFFFCFIIGKLKLICILDYVFFEFYFYIFVFFVLEFFMNSIKQQRLVIQFGVKVNLVFIFIDKILLEYSEIYLVFYLFDYMLKWQLINYG